MARSVMVGVDLGTSKCLAGIAIRESVHWIPAGREFESEFAADQNPTAGHGFLPSVYCFGKNDATPVGQSEEFLGQKAIDFQGINPGGIIRNSKRCMHRQYESNGSEPFHFTVRDDSGTNRKLKPGDVAGKLLRHLLKQSEHSLRTLKSDLDGTWDWNNGRILRAVITVPAYFGSDERRATKEYAGEICCGLEQVELLEEPLAAAIGLGLHKSKTPQTVMIVDVGAGTTDLALLRVGERDIGIREIGRFGDNNLGCLDWDVKIAKLLLSKGLEDDPNLEDRLCAFDVTSDVLGSHDLNHGQYGFAREGAVLSVAERAKIYLCNEKNSKPFYAEWQEQNRNPWVWVSRDEMESETRHFATWIGKVCQRLLDSVNLVQQKENGTRGTTFSWDQIDRVFLVGGGARIPQIQRAIAKVMTPKYETRLTVAEMPEILVAKGAALYAEMFAKGEGLDAIAQRRLPHDIGITTHVLSRKDDPHCDVLAERGVHFIDIIPANASLPKTTSDPPRIGSRVLPFSNPNEPRVELQLWERSFSIDSEDGLLKPLGLIQFDGTEPLWKGGGYLWGLPVNFELTLELDIHHKLTARIKYGKKFEEIPVRPPFPVKARQ